MFVLVTLLTKIVMCHIPLKPNLNVNVFCGRSQKTDQDLMFPFLTTNRYWFTPYLLMAYNVFMNMYIYLFQITDTPDKDLVFELVTLPTENACAPFSPMVWYTSWCIHMQLCYRSQTHQIKTWCLSWWHYSQRMVMRRIHSSWVPDSKPKCGSAGRTTSSGNTNYRIWYKYRYHTQRIQVMPNLPHGQTVLLWYPNCTLEDYLRTVKLHSAALQYRVPTAPGKLWKMMKIFQPCKYHGILKFWKI